MVASTNIATVDLAQQKGNFVSLTYHGKNVTANERSAHDFRSHSVCVRKTSSPKFCKNLPTSSFLLSVTECGRIQRVIEKKFLGKNQTYAVKF